MELESLPHPLTWQPEPPSWKVSEGGFSAEAAGRTDLFVDPFGRSTALNAAKLLFETSDDFTLSARVTVDFRGTFDAGVLVVYQDDASWAKLCLEFSPQGQPMVVSVVTRGTSDDCNSEVLEGATAFLRVARLGTVYALHHSHDGSYWQLVRVFALDDRPTRAGFLVQAPVGEGCRARFEAIRFRSETLGDLRSGA